MLFSFLALLKKIKHSAINHFRNSFANRINLNSLGKHFFRPSQYHEEFSPYPGRCPWLTRKAEYTLWLRGPSCSALQTPHPAPHHQISHWPLWLIVSLDTCLALDWASSQKVPLGSSSIGYSQWYPLTNLTQLESKTLPFTSWKSQTREPLMLFSIRPPYTYFLCSFPMPMIYFIKESTYSTLNLYSPTLSPNNEIPKENFPYQSPYHSSPEDNEAAPIQC